MKPTIQLTSTEASLVIRALLTHRDEVEKHRDALAKLSGTFSNAASLELKLTKALLKKLEA